MTSIRSLVACFLWVLGAAVVSLAARVQPKRIRRYEADGARLIAELPREQVLAPPAEWMPGLMAYAAWPHPEVRA